MSKEAKPTASRRVLALILLVGVVIVLAVGIWLSSRPVPVQLQGMIDTDEVRVAAKATGRLETILVGEGDKVTPGQLLFTLHNAELDAKLNEATAAEVSMRALHAKAEKGAQDEDIAAAKAVWLAQQTAAEVTAKTAARMQKLHGEGVISAQKHDEAVAAAIASAESAKAAQQQYEKALAGTRVEDKAASAAHVAQAMAAVAAVKSIEDELKATAPIGGEITKRFANVGEIVPPGFPVFAMIDPQDVWVSFSVRENQFSGIEINKVLTGIVPALDNARLQFRVYFIDPQGSFATWRAVRQSEGFDVKTFEVRARPVEANSKLRPGMSVLFDWPQK